MFAFDADNAITEFVVAWLCDVLDVDPGNFAFLLFQLAA